MTFPPPPPGMDVPDTVTPYLDINPPIFNSASPWATTKEQLQRLLECPAVGAITTRTSLLRGFVHDPEKHRFVFFNQSNGRNEVEHTYSYPELDMVSRRPDGGPGLLKTVTYNENVLPSPQPDEWSATLNSLGYSPIPLEGYIQILIQLGREVSDAAREKTAIISVTGPEHELTHCHDLLVHHSEEIPFKLAMEVNLSCPNIDDSSPLAYDQTKLTRYVRALPIRPIIPVGVKFPPYTYKEQFHMVRAALLDAQADKRLCFVTAVNTLGCCCVTNGGENSGSVALPGEGMGGMAGPPLHPLALGNVKYLGQIVLDGVLSNIEIIGVGGVADGKGYLRMRSMGANFVALASALGKEGGPEVFNDIESEIMGQWDEYDAPH